MMPKTPKTPTRKCCGHYPYIESWWDLTGEAVIQRFAVGCDICGLNTRIGATSREEAIQYWDDEEVC